MQAPPDSPVSSILLAVVAVLFIGLSKAGFGGGLGMLTTPLCALAFGPRDAIGILLPLLCAGDAFSLYHYWGQWEKANLRYLLPGVVVGVVVGVQFIGRFSARELNIAIGVLAVAFVVFQFVKAVIYRAEGRFVPNYKLGLTFGVGAGLTSSFAHGAGPVVTMFLMPQALSKEVFVGTTVLIFTWINWVKMPFFVAGGLINPATLKQSLIYFPIVPLGVWAGVWLNRRLPGELFSRLIYIFTLLSGLQLIFNFDLRRLW